MHAASPRNQHRASAATCIITSFHSHFFSPLPAPRGGGERSRYAVERVCVWAVRVMRGGQHWRKSIRRHVVRESRCTPISFEFYTLRGHAAAARARRGAARLMVFCKLVALVRSLVFRITYLPAPFSDLRNV